MRLLAAADLHYSLPQFDWVLESAPDFDVVVLAGDHLELSSLVDRRAQSVVVRKYFSRLREVTRLVICSGNHDLDAPNETGEKIAKWLGPAQHEGVPSDGESFLLDDTLFTVCPWWDGPTTRA
ncbi:MAG: metallophosphoesterase, partial [Methyloceanibacter sp.]